MKLTGIAFGALVLILGVGAAACGSDNNDNSATATRPATQASGSPASGGAPSASELSVTAKDFSFDPGDLDGTMGQPIKVELKNDGSATHTLTVYEDDAYTKPVSGADTGRVSAGSTGSFTTTFAAAQNYFFRCEVHPTQMKGEINIH